MNAESRRLTDEERLDWLRLWRSEHIGPRAFADLVRMYGAAGAALERLPELARRGGLRRRVRVCSRADAERERDALAAAGGRFAAACEPDYPRALAAIDDPPPILAVLGRLPPPGNDAVAIVGARNASAAGGRFARGLAADLGAAGYAIVSGLARGIDAQAHLGALDTGTAAVVAGGVDVVYPRENADLYARIVETGAVVSERPLGAAPKARHFPRRNRIVSGLCAGVAVVEATPRSGSLITARLAAEQGREVFAVPGSPLDPRHRGANGLIRDGATLIESAEDVIAALNGSRPGREPPRIPAVAEAFECEELDPPANGAPGDPGAGRADDDPEAAQRAIMEALDAAPIGVDELVRQCHLPASAVMTAVLELELAGRIARRGSGRVFAPR